MWIILISAVLAAVVPAIIWVILHLNEEQSQKPAPTCTPQAGCDLDEKPDDVGVLRREPSLYAASATCDLLGVVDVPCAVIARVLEHCEDSSTRWRAAAACKCWLEASKGATAVVTTRVGSDEDVVALCAALASREVTGLRFVGAGRTLSPPHLADVLHRLPPWIKELDLTACPVTDGDLCCCEHKEPLCGAPAMAARLSCESMSGSSRETTHAPVPGARSPFAFRLASLDVSMTGFGDGCVECFLVPTAQSLRVLKVAHCAALSELGLSSIASACRRLETLDVSYLPNVQTGLSIPDLLRANAGTLQELDLSGLPVTDVHVDLITSHLLRIAALRLFGCKLVTAQAVGRLLSKNTLQVLDIGLCQQLSTSWGESGCDVALFNDGTARLRRLGLYRTCTPAMLRALVRSDIRHSLRSLDIRACDSLGDGDIPSLCELRALRSLEIQGTRLTAIHDLQSRLPECEVTRRSRKGLRSSWRG